jgi:hypothetical protein
MPKKNQIAKGMAAKIPAHPFLRISLQQDSGTVLDALKSQLGSRIPDYAAKLARRKK